MPLMSRLSATLLFSALFLLGGVMAPPTIMAQDIRMSTLVDSLAGAVGGVAVDRGGAVYTADFRDTVWKIEPDGRVSRFATGLYGASGNTFDSEGRLLQSNFFGHTLTRIDRDGTKEVVVRDGLNGPVGVTVHPSGQIYLDNCAGNEVVRIDPADWSVHPFASGELFRCPNGIIAGPDSALYVVNFSDPYVVRIGLDGHAERFATIPGGGNGHIAVAGGSFFVTAFQTHEVYRVDMDGTVSLAASDGLRFPNGIAAGPAGDRVYINEYVNRFPPNVEHPPVPHSRVRQLQLPGILDVMVQALRSTGVEGMVRAHDAFKKRVASYTELDLNGLGYALLNQGQLQAAVEVFRLNVRDYPASANVYDSLAEALAGTGDTEGAIANYRRSLELNPGNTNAETQLKRLENR